MALAGMTELEAINLMLSTIGEAPVNSLESTGLSDVAVARSILLEVSREVQDDGWNFNQEDEVELSLSIDGFVYIPSNALRVENVDYQDIDVTIRGDRLYDRRNHTFIFTEPYKFQITYLLEYTDLPQAARYFIAIRASRKFQRRILTAEVVEKFTENDELEAKANLQDQDTSAGDYNLINDSWDIARIHVR